MKTLKTHKILVLLLSVLALFATYLAFAGGFTAKAEVIGSNYFTYQNGSADLGDVVFENNVAEIKTYRDNALKFKNELVVDDFGIELFLNNDFTSTTLTLELPSYDKNGAYYKNGANETYETTVKNNVVISVDSSSQLTACFNNTSAKVITPVFTGGKVVIKVQRPLGSEYLQASISFDGNPYVNLSEDVYGVDIKDYYKVNVNETPVAKVSISQNPKGDNGLIHIESISQKTADDNFKQNFEIEEGKIKTVAYPRVVVDSSLYNYNGTDNCYHVIAGIPYSLSIKGKSFIDGDTASGYKFVGGDDSVLVNGTSVAFIESDVNKTLYVKSSDDTKTYEEITVKAISSETDVKAPEYNLEDRVINAFKQKLNSLIYEYDAEGNRKTKLSIGSGEYLTLSADMFRNLVSDDLSSFDKLSHVIYYWTPAGDEQSVSTYKIPLNTEGTYTFFVSFTDQAGNSMDKDNFYTVSVDDENVLVEGRGYSGVMFTFSIEDNTTLSISSSTPGYGYTGIEYNASSFKIVGNSHTETYKLYYSATDIGEEDEGWVEIVAKANAKDENATYNGYTYKEISSINYDGKLDFTPDKVGYYKLVCNSRSTVSLDSAEKAVIIEVKDQVKIVKPDSHWLENNVWSVVFLSVGTLCLIAIIVILCIKPKNPDDVD